MLTHVGILLHREEETLKICPIIERSKPYLEGPVRLGIADVRETNKPEKQNLHLMPWCKPQMVAPQEAPC